LSWIGGGVEFIVSQNSPNARRAALLRPKFRKYATVDAVGAYLTPLEHRASMVVDPEPGSRLAPDPGGDDLIALAKGAAAHFPVSRDAHLTGLGRSQRPIVTLRAFLSTLEKDDCRDRGETIVAGPR